MIARLSGSSLMTRLRLDVRSESFSGMWRALTALRSYICGLEDDVV